ncbi:MAG: hypothetical protein ACAH22_00030 [Tardiphaga sp.]
MMKRFNNLRRSGPKCTAIAKRSGQQCRQSPMANGKCYLHGGRTPKGDGWHRPLWPDGAAPNATERLNRKLEDLQQAAKKRARRLRAMTPDERADYAAWLRSHKPGSAKAREAARIYRKQDANGAATLREVRERPISDEERATAARIAEIKAEIAAIEARLAELDAPEPQSTEEMGIFG